MLLQTRIPKTPCDSKASRPPHVKRHQDEFENKMRHGSRHFGYRCSLYLNEDRQMNLQKGQRAPVVKYSRLDPDRVPSRISRWKLHSLHYPFTNKLKISNYLDQAYDDVTRMKIDAPEAVAAPFPYSNSWVWRQLPSQSPESTGPRKHSGWIRFIRMEGSEKAWRTGDGSLVCQGDFNYPGWSGNGAITIERVEDDFII